MLIQFFFPKAEDFCLSQGKHLASITSNEEEKEVGKLMSRGTGGYWLGGQRHSKQGLWHWVDGKEWQFEGKWEEDSGGECLSLDKRGDFTMPTYWWRRTQCNETHGFVCRDATNTVIGNEIFVLTKESFQRQFHVKWVFDPAEKEEDCSGIHIDWRIENGTEDIREFVSSELSGTVSTPGLGKVLNGSNYIHEYKAVINLPHNVTKILGDAALVVDLDVTVTQPDNGVELWSSDLEWAFRTANWREAELDCLSKGGHLARATSSLKQQKIEAFFVDKNKYLSFKVWNDFRGFRYV